MYRLLGESGGCRAPVSPAEVPASEGRGKESGGWGRIPPKGVLKDGANAAGGLQANTLCARRGFSGGT